MSSPSDRKKVARMIELERLALSRIDWGDAYEYLTEEEQAEYDKLNQY